MSPGAPHGYGHAMGQALGESRADAAALRGELAALKHEHAEQILELLRFKDSLDRNLGQQGIDSVDPALNLRTEGRFESREDFAKRLKGAGLLELNPSAKHEGQHVYHIISASNGGPDHTDNYLFALGGSFNITVGDRFDHLNCFLAGKSKARKAVAIALKVADDPSLHHHIDRRGRPRATTFREGPHNRVSSGDELYKRGQDLFRDMRKDTRAAR